MRSPLLRGVLAGAAGTLALNVATYLDMAIRGRAPSPMPGQAVDKLVRSVGIGLGEGEAEENRKQGLGALLGYGMGVAVGVGYALVRRRIRVSTPAAAGGIAAAAMVASDSALTALRLTDPRRWSASDWAMDVVPHVVYGVVTAATYDAAAE